MEEIKKEPVTAGLIFLNTLIFLIVEFTGGSENGQHMLECGAAYAPLILEQGEWYRIFSSMFLHFGLPHLVNNMLVLFVMGQRLEPAVGRMRFLLIYLAGGIGGNIVSLCWDMHTGVFAVSAGASGAVFAVIGGMIYVIIRHKGRVADLTMRQMIIMAAFHFTSDLPVKVWIMLHMPVECYVVFWWQFLFIIRGKYGRQFHDPERFLRK